MSVWGVSGDFGLVWSGFLGLSNTIPDGPGCLFLSNLLPRPNPILFGLLVGGVTLSRAVDIMLFISAIPMSLEVDGDWSSCCACASLIGWSVCASGSISVVNVFSGVDFQKVPSFHLISVEWRGYSSMVEHSAAVREVPGSNSGVP